MEPIEVTAKKVDDAIREGLRLLGTTLDKVEYKVISSGGLFKKAKISIALVEDESEKAARKQREAKHNETLRDANKGIHQQEKPAGEQPQKDIRYQEKPAGEQSKKDIRQQEKPAGEQPKKDIHYQEKLIGELSKQAQAAMPYKDFKQNQQLRSSSPAVSPKTEYQPIRQKETSQRSYPAAGQPKQSVAQQKPARFNRERFQQPAEARAPETKSRARTQEIGEDDVKRALDFTTVLIGLMGIEAQIKTNIIDGDLVIDLESENGALIGYRGETLDAIEYLVSIQANKDKNEYINIIVDSCGYRKKREKMLISMAEKAANRCIKMGRKVIMEPMNRSSRKIVHSTLSTYNNITSKSEGIEPNRQIVIYFKRGRNDNSEKV